MKKLALFALIALFSVNVIDAAAPTAPAASTTPPVAKSAAPMPEEDVEVADTGADEDGGDDADGGADAGDTDND